MNYTLNPTSKNALPTADRASLKKFLPFLKLEQKFLLLALGAVILNSIFNLLSPALIGRTIDQAIAKGNFMEVVRSAGLLLVIYLLSLGTGYLQTRIMGGVGQRTLFNLRKAVFNKLAELPLAFFNQNKAGDLISRINNDTDNLNQFFSQALVQFVSNTFMVIGAGIFILSLNPRLGAAGLLPALALLVCTLIVSPYIRRKNAASLASVGQLSAEIQENLENFRIIIAFNRQDYFRKRFAEVNEANFRHARAAGIATTVFLNPLYTLIANTAQLAVLIYGIYLIMHGAGSIGLLISFISYLARFYDPLRQIAALYAQFQVALGSWERISDILSLQSDLLPTPPQPTFTAGPLLTFNQVDFAYENGITVLSNINITLERGKTYALVGPTGGGKTTTASLMAHLYNPTRGTICLNGSDIRSFTDTERAAVIGFILQDPFLFTGTIKDNLVYGSSELEKLSTDELLAILLSNGLAELITRFKDGLDTLVTPGSTTLSLGQRQLIAFIRAVLRKPALLILDEATANIDTVTERELQIILNKLPATTTRVIIAHRLNTIEQADEIFFVNSGTITPAGSFAHAVELLMHHKRNS